MAITRGRTLLGLGAGVLLVAGCDEEWRADVSQPSIQGALFIPAEAPNVESEPAIPAAAPPAVATAGHLQGHGDPSRGSDRSGLVPEDSVLLSFEELASFWYEPPDPEEVVENPDFRPEDQFPAFLRAYDGKKVSVEGYVVPLSIEKGRVKAFILSRYVSNCCYGLMPELNEWLEVEMPEGKGLDFLPYGTVITTGTLHVGEVFDEYGYVRTLYRIEAEKVDEPVY